MGAGWGAIAAAAGSSALGYLGGESANKASLKAVKRKAQWDERAYKHRYQWQMEDLRAAGLNPMLSIGSAPPQGPSMGMPHIRNSLGEGVAAGVSTYNSAKQAELMDQQKDLVRAQTQKTDNEGKVVELEADISQRMRDPETVEQLAKVRAESANQSLENLRGQGEVLKSTLRVNEAEIRNKDQNTVNAKLDEQLKSLDIDQRKVVYPIIVRYKKAEAELMESGLPEAEAKKRAWEKMGLGGVVNEELRKWLDAVPLPGIIWNSKRQSGGGSSAKQRLPDEWEWND